MNYKNYSLLIVFVILVLPVVSLAAFEPLVGIPQLEGTEDLGSYINALYALSISLAALLAVIKIIIAGVKWMLSDVVTSKQEAKEDMKGALLGLLIVISAVLVLGQINPQLVATDLVLTKVNTAPLNYNPSGSGAIPPATPRPVVPSNIKVLSCDFDASGNEDCSAQEAQCLGGGGKVNSGDSNLLAPKVRGLLTCQIGEHKSLSCTALPGGGFDCDLARVACSDAYEIYTQMSEHKANCYTPY